MQPRTWIVSLAGIVTLCLVSTLSFARPHTDPAHRSTLPVTVTLTNGTRHMLTLEGVGCLEAMCSRVRALDSHADSVWLDGLSSVREISRNYSGPVHAVFTFRDGTTRSASIAELNRVVYLKDEHGRDWTVDLASLAQIDFN
jgi:hypothetical protein